SSSYHVYTAVVRPENRQRLPLSVRRVTVTACGNNRSVQDVERARNMMDEVSKSQKILFLPVFFSNLDPAEISTSDQLDSIDPDTRTRIARAAVSLDGIFHIREKPIVTGVTLSPRVFPWVFFIHTHWDQLPGIAFLPAVTFYTEFLNLCGLLPGPFTDVRSHKGITGIRVMLGNTFPNSRSRACSRPCSMTFTVSCSVVTLPIHPHLAEITEGCGGDIDDLAHFVIQYMSIVARRPSSISNVYYIRGLLGFISDADVLSSEDVPRRIPMFFHGHKWLEEAITNGLGVIAACATMECAREIDAHLRFLLNNLLSAGLVHYYVVLRLRTALAAVVDLSTTDAFRESELFPDWGRFLNVAEDPGTCLRQQQARSLAFNAAPDVSPSITTRALVKPQIGGRVAIGRSVASPCSWASYIGLIYAEQVKLMSAHPSGDPFFTLFDYSVTPVVIVVHSLENSPIGAILKDGGAEWLDILPRVANSGGRIHLHIMRVP
ncbi:hypothetical protein C8R44DRAFT_949477, partial [Mycena epipterygia]